MADDRRKSKLVPIVALTVVVLIGAVGLVRGCGYATEPTPAETNGQATREAPDV